MYSHHYLSIIIILITVIPIHIISIFTENYEDYFSIVGLMFLPELLFSFMYVSGAKYLLLTKGNIYKLLFFDGIIGIILSILLQIIIHYFIKCDLIEGEFKENYCDENGFKTIIKNIKSIKFFYGILSILLVLASFLEKCFTWLLIYNFSANHFAAIYPIPLFFYQIIINNEAFKLENYIMLILESVIIIFTSFVYNEIIILRFCGFEKNTVIEISKRSVREFSCDFGDDTS